MTTKQRVDNSPPVEPIKRYDPLPGQLDLFGDEDNSPRDYKRFLAQKRTSSQPTGFDVSEDDNLNPNLFDWQRDIVRWSLKQGKSALFEECGLGKTIQQLVWAQKVCEHTGGDVLILSPLAVASQTVQEAQKFGISSRVGIKTCLDYLEVKPGISVVNYERIHKLDCKRFSGVVLDESSILKAFTGKIKNQLCGTFRNTPYKLCCTATPAPNDLLEIGNHCDFLDVMPSNEMIARWFINDTMAAGNYRLKKHAAQDYWRWVASWAISVSKPSDLNFCDDGFDLPPLNITQKIVESDELKDPDGFLFNAQKISATNLHAEKRCTAKDRAAAVAEIVNNSKESWVVWCDTNYEADELAAMVNDAVEVRGSDTIKQKEERIDSFSRGETRVIISKPSLAGFGVNWQHCHNVAFVGLSYSFEAFYQAVRRCWRFGQKHPVNVYVFQTEGEAAISSVVFSKQDAHKRMKSEMTDAMRESCLANLYGRKKLAGYDPQEQMQLPKWLQAKSVHKA